MPHKQTYSQTCFSSQIPEQSTNLRVTENSSSYENYLILIKDDIHCWPMQRIFRLDKTKGNVF